MQGIFALVNIRDYIQQSSVRRGLDVIGDRWVLLILLGAFCGVERFDDWKRQLRMSPSVLSVRLKRLVNVGILEKLSIEGTSHRHRYILTDKGSELFQWALAVWRWESLWVYQDREHPVSLFHKPCGNHTEAELVCNGCETAVNRYNVSVKERPGFRSDPVSQPARYRRSNMVIDDSGEHQYVGQFVDIMGDRWSFLVLSAAFLGARRFEEFQNQLDIATNILSDRLRRLVEGGMLARNRYRKKPARSDYILTEKSIEFNAVPLALALWGDKWLANETGPSVIRYHDTCGNELRVKSICDHCGEELRREDISFSNAGSLSRDAV